MILSAIPWLSISINLLLVVFAIISALMVLLIVMQRPKQEGLGAAFGGGVTDQVFGARTTDVLQRGTVYLGSMFFILSLALAILIGLQNKQKSLLTPKSAIVKKVEVTPAPPVMPKSLTSELPIEASTAPVITPQPPASPEVLVPTLTPTPVEIPAPTIPPVPQTPVVPTTPVVPAVPEAP